MSVTLSCCNLGIPNQSHEMSLVYSTKPEDNLLTMAPYKGKNWSYCPFCGKELTA